MNKYPKTGCLVTVMILMAGMAAIVMTSRGTGGYLDSGYQKDYQSEHFEVGSVLRLPIGTPLPIGRKFAIIVSPIGRTDEARIVRSLSSSEIPQRPVFVSGSETGIVYSISTSGDHYSIDLSNWKSCPLRTDSSPKPILESKTPKRAADK